MKSTNVVPFFSSMFLTGILTLSALAEEDRPIEIKGSCSFNFTTTHKDVSLSYTPGPSFLGLAFSPLGQGTLTVDGEIFSVANVDVRTAERPAGLEKELDGPSFEKDLKAFHALWPERVNSHVVRVLLGSIVKDVEDKKITVGSFVLEDRQELTIPSGAIRLRDRKYDSHLTAAEMAYLDDQFPGCALTQTIFTP